MEGVLIYSDPPHRAAYWRMEMTAHFLRHAAIFFLMLILFVASRTLPATAILSPFYALSTFADQNADDWYLSACRPDRMAAAVEHDQVRAGKERPAARHRPCFRSIHGGRIRRSLNRLTAL